jgi:Lysozyme like domain
MIAKRSLLALLALAFFTTACVSEDDEDYDDSPMEVTADDSQGDEAFDQEVADAKEDAALTYSAVARLAKNAGVTCTGDRIALAVAVAKAESGFRPTITNTAGNAHGIDRGLWQVNSYWHPEVSKTCALSASCNARAMARISRGGTRWSEWWTWKNGKHLPFMSSARTAQRAVCQ